MKGKDDFTKVWGAFPKDLRDELIDAIEESSAESPEEFLNEIFVGECPSCVVVIPGTVKNYPKERALSLDYAIQAATSNTPNAGGLLKKAVPVRTGTYIFERCTRRRNRFGDCGIPTWECKKIYVFEEADNEETLHMCAWCNKVIDQTVEIFAVGAKA